MDEATSTSTSVKADDLLLLPAPDDLNGVALLWRVGAAVRKVGSAEATFANSNHFRDPNFGDQKVDRSTRVVTGAQF